MVDKSLMELQSMHSCFASSQVFSLAVYKKSITIYLYSNLVTELIWHTPDFHVKTKVVVARIFYLNRVSKQGHVNVKG